MKRRAVWEMVVGPMVNRVYEVSRWFGPGEASELAELLASLRRRELQPDATGVVSYSALREAPPGTIYRVKEESALQGADMEAFQPVFQEAIKVWAEQILAAVEARVAAGGVGDIGTCVLGAGIEVDYLPPRARTAQARMVCHPPTRFQGSCTWEGEPLQAALEVLKRNGIPARYNPGRMD